MFFIDSCFFSLYCCNNIHQSIERFKVLTLTKKQNRRGATQFLFEVKVL